MNLLHVLINVHLKNTLILFVVLDLNTQQKTNLHVRSLQQNQNHMKCYVLSSFILRKAY